VLADRDLHGQLRQTADLECFVALAVRPVALVSF
jgi:hypothetical protein